MLSRLNLSSYYQGGQKASSADELETAEVPETYDVLSFFATAQALQISHLPIVWDTDRAIIGVGATSRIHESEISLGNNFAFKDYQKLHKTDEQIFQSLVTETIVLSQPFVRGHRNIVQLQGFCWDMSDIDKPRPALVFEKSDLGDLSWFATLDDAGMRLQACERLWICLDVAKAVVDMHDNGIIHGDIKPENVLIFTGDVDKYFAKVIDFGFSSPYNYNKEPLVLALSHPWNAPENTVQRTAWTPEEAERADMFSLGMLFFWLLFEPLLSGRKPTTEDVEHTDVNTLGKARDLLHKMKTEETIQKYALRFLEMEEGLDEEDKVALRSFFGSALSINPEEREMEILYELLINLDQRDSDRGTSIVNIETSLNPENIVQPGNNFKIENSIYDLYRTDYRVRSYIGQKVEDMFRQSPSAPVALQLALCYYIGFGLGRDESKAMQVLHQSGQTIQDVQNIIHGTSRNPNEYMTSKIYQLTIAGSMAWIDFAELYLRQGRINEALERVTQETSDLATTCGENHFLTILSKDMLARIYVVQGQWKQAEKPFREVMEFSRDDPEIGPEHRNTVVAKSNLAWLYRKQSLWEKSELLEKEMIETTKKAPGQDCEEMLGIMASLASTYRGQGRYAESENMLTQVVEMTEGIFGAKHSKTLMRRQSLATTLLEAKVKGQSADSGWRRIEQLLRQIEQDSGLGALKYARNAEDSGSQPTIPVTTDVDKLLRSENRANIYLTAMDTRGEVCRLTQKYPEAEKIHQLVLDARKEILGPDHPDTLRSTDNLGMAIFMQGRYPSAEALFRQVVASRGRVLWPDHPDTLRTVDNLGIAVFKQGRIKDAEELFRSNAADRSKTQGTNHPDTLASLRLWRQVEMLLNKAELEEL